jgi:hypothetical protein
MACWLPFTTPELKAFELIVTELTIPDHKILKVMANHPGFLNRPLVRLGLFQLTTPELMVLQMRVLFQLFFKPSKKKFRLLPQTRSLHGSTNIISDPRNQALLFRWGNTSVLS